MLYCFQNFSRSNSYMHFFVTSKCALIELDNCHIHFLVVVFRINENFLRKNRDIDDKRKLFFNYEK